MPTPLKVTLQAHIQQLILASEAENELLTQLKSESTVHTSYLFGTYDTCTGSAFVSVVLPLPAVGLIAEVYAKGGLDVFRQFCSDAQCLGMWMRTADLQPIGVDALLTTATSIELESGLLLGVGQCNGSLRLAAVGIGADGVPTALPIAVEN